MFDSPWDVARALTLALAFGGSAATIAAPSFQNQQIFSNADGSIQYVLLRESAGQSGPNHFAGLT
jgi:hypothetical protein